MHTQRDLRAPIETLFPIDDTVVVVASTHIIDAEQTLRAQVKYIDSKVERGTERRGRELAPGC